MSALDAIRDPNREVRREAIGTARFYRRSVVFFRRVLVERACDAALIPEDIVGYMWPVIVKAAHLEGLPALVFPYTVANQQEALQSLRDQDAFQTANNRLAAERHPRWRLREAGVDLVRLPSAHIFAHEWIRIAPPDPWMMNSGYSDRICVDSAFSLDYFHSSGIPLEQMEVVGSVSQDHMFGLRRDKAAHLATLCRDLGLSGDKPVLLLSGCPNQLTSNVPYCEFADFESIATFVGEALAPLTADYHLVVRPHPNFPEFGALLERHGFVSTMIPTSRLVPLSSLFVAFASATIRWAIACAVPTVNYDVFHYGYADFASAAGVVSVDEKNQFMSTVRALGPKTVRYAELLAGSHVDSERWSVMDGRGIDRIEAAIRQTRALRAGATTATLESRSA